ncbi:MAG: hypothetical protein ABIH87_04705 [bacterium]
MTKNESEVEQATEEKMGLIEVIEMLCRVGMCLLATSKVVEDVFQEVVDTLEEEAKSMIWEVHSYVDDSAKLGGYAVVPLGSHMPKVEARAIDLINNREQFEQLMYGFQAVLSISRSSSGALGNIRLTVNEICDRMETFDQFWKSHITDFMVVNDWRFKKTSAMLSRWPERQVPWWYGLRNQCDLRAVSELIVDQLKLDSEQGHKLVQHVDTCPHCRVFYKEGRELMDGRFGQED